MIVKFKQPLLLPAVIVGLAMSIMGSGFQTRIQPTAGHTLLFDPDKTRIQSFPGHSPFFDSAETRIQSFAGHTLVLIQTKPGYSPSSGIPWLLIQTTLGCCQSLDIKKPEYECFIIRQSIAST